MPIIGLVIFLKFKQKPVLHIMQPLKMLIRSLC